MSDYKMWCWKGQTKYLEKQLAIQTDHKITAMQHRDLLQEQLEKCRKFAADDMSDYVKLKAELKQKDKEIRQLYELAKSSDRFINELKARNEKLERVVDVAKFMTNHYLDNGIVPAATRNNIGYLIETIKLNDDQRIKESRDE